MAFFDWNHDGKKDYVDNAIEMMIFDDIEQEEIRNRTEQPYSGSGAYKKANQLSQEEVDEAIRAMRPAFLTWGTVLAAVILICNLIGLVGGYVSVSGIIVSVVALIFIVRNVKKHKADARKK